MAKYVHNGSYLTVKLETEAEDIVLKIIAFLENQNTLADLLNHALEEDLIKNNLENISELINSIDKALDVMANNIEIQMTNLSTLYINATEEEKIKITTDLSFLVNEHSEIKCLIDEFMNKFNLEYVNDIK